jgi:dTDP-4-amino-4,6-dideoxygalactose transaminase
MTTGEGGASAWNLEGVDNEKIYKQYQLFSLHGQDKSALAKTRIGSWEYDIVGPWYKCNMADTLACIGLRQLERYPQMLEKRKDYIGKYDAVCDGLGLFHLKHSGVDYQSSGHLYITRIPDIGEQERNEIITKLAELGVGANVHYKPLPMMTAYKAYGWDIKDFPNAYDYYHNLITLPLYTKMTGEDVDYVIEVFSQVVKDYI